MLLDGQPLNEVQVYAQALAAEGMPVLVRERRPLDARGAWRRRAGRRRLVPTKEGQGRARARSHARARPGRSWRAAIAAALAAPPEPPPARSYPAELRIVAEGKELLARPSPAPADLLRGSPTAFRASQVSREYRQLAKLLPGRRLAGAARAPPPRLAAATPVMLARSAAGSRRPA